jgi:hypothetical protein
MVQWFEAVTYGGNEMGNPMGSAFKNWQQFAAYDAVRREQWQRWAERESDLAAMQAAELEKERGKDGGPK